MKTLIVHLIYLIWTTSLDSWTLNVQYTRIGEDLKTLQQSKTKFTSIFCSVMHQPKNIHWYTRPYKYQGSDHKISSFGKFPQKSMITVRYWVFLSSIYFTQIAKVVWPGSRGNLWCFINPRCNSLTQSFATYIHFLTPYCFSTFLSFNMYLILKFTHRIQIYILIIF